LGPAQPDTAQPRNFGAVKKPRTTEISVMAGQKTSFCENHYFIISNHNKAKKNGFEAIKSNLQEVTKEGQKRDRHQTYRRALHEGTRSFRKRVPQ
jgi:7-keto-8-aminopelargonate synthetase-like enzyme